MLLKLFRCGSEINSGLFHEPDEKFFKSWSDTYGTRNLTIEAVKPYLKEVKQITNVDQNRDFVNFENAFISTAENMAFLEQIASIYERYGSSEQEVHDPNLSQNSSSK